MKDGGIDLDELASILEREFESADSYRGEMRQYEELALDYYEGKPFGNETPGRSQIVMPDVQRTLDHMTQSVMRTFVSGDHTVEFEAGTEEDEQAAEEATEAINYVFMRQQDGYRILHDGLFDGLLRRIGIFKTAVETVEKVTRDKVQIGDPLQLGMLPDGVEVEAFDPETGIAELKTERVEKRFVDCAVPTSEFRFSPNARHEDEADYLAHIVRKTRSDLVEMGFDKDQVAGLPSHDNRVEDRVDQYQWREQQTTPEMELIDLCEEYARIDIDGDGIAERIKVFRVAKEILIDAETGKPSVETVDEQPFAVFSPFIRAHRLVGYSLAEKEMDLQLARLFAARQLFDGMALANMPRPIVDTGAIVDGQTMEDILNPIPGSPIRIRGGASSIQPLANGFNIGQSLQALEWLTGEAESRTGITRLNQGLDADAMNKTATGTAMLQAQGQQVEEMIARQLAETLSRLFRKKYRLIRAEGEPLNIKSGGQYKQVDPSTWPEDMSVIVRVGLGSNSKDKRIQYRMALASALTASVQQGFSGAEHVFEWFDGMAKDTGIGRGDDFAFDPAQQQGEKPDPNMAKVEAEAQAQQARLQGEQQLAQARLQIMQQEGQTKQQLAREQAEFDAQLARDRAEHEARLAEDRLAMEQRLAEQRMAIEVGMAEQKASIAQQSSDAKLSSNRPGGSLAE